MIGHHRSHDVTEYLDSSLLSSAIVTFTLMQASSCFKWLQLLQASHPDAEAATIETDQLFLVSPSLE